MRSHYSFPNAANSTCKLHGQMRRRIPDSVFVSVSRIAYPSERVDSNFTTTQVRNWYKGSTWNERKRCEILLESRELGSRRAKRSEVYPFAQRRETERYRCYYNLSPSDVKVALRAIDVYSNRDLHTLGFSINVKISSVNSKIHTESSGAKLRRIRIVFVKHAERKRERDKDKWKGNMTKIEKSLSDTQETYIWYATRTRYTLSILL